MQATGTIACSRLTTQSGRTTTPALDPSPVRIGKQVNLGFKRELTIRMPNHQGPVPETLMVDSSRGPDGG